MACGLADVVSPSAGAGPCGALVDEWQDAWNRHDAALLAGLVAGDVDFVTVAGRWLRGRREFHEWHKLIHRTHLQLSRWTNLACRSRSLHSDLMLVHLEWRIDNEIRAGSPRPLTRLGVFTWLVAREGGAAAIVAAHNTNLAEDTPHRLAGAGQGE
jgi:uncharacterized protein (TIGR02246 family)